MTRVRIAFYTENYAVGGCDRFLADLAGNLDPKLFEISLAGNRNAAFDEWLARRIPTLLPRHEVRVATLPTSRLVRFGEHFLSRETNVASGRRSVGAPSAIVDAGSAALRYTQALPNYVRLRRLFRRLRPDLLHINNGGYPGGETCRLAALAARAEGVPAVVHFVHSTASAASFPAGVEHALDRSIDHATDLWLTAAGRAATALHERRGIALKRIETVYYGIEPQAAPSEPPPGRRCDERPVAAVVASFDPGKGHAVLIDALAHLKAERFPIFTRLVGQGPERTAIEQRTLHAGVVDDIQFLGWRDDVPSILSSSDLLVLPSVRYECLPYSILEAMSHGLPVVATDLAGIPEQVVDGVTGRIVPPGDARALAHAIRDVASDLSRARGMGVKGKERVEAVFSLDRMVAQMSEIYLRVAPQVVRPGR
jgi:glycosyltransferase involved in cell wall biosynthesis